jgi:hypothetical protein
VRIATRVYIDMIDCLFVFDLFSCIVSFSFFTVVSQWELESSL